MMSLKHFTKCYMYKYKVHNWCQSKTNLARNHSFTVETKVINQNINYDVLHEQEYDKIRTIVESTDCKFGLSANGLSRAENDELLKHV